MKKMIKYIAIFFLVFVSCKHETILLNQPRNEDRTIAAFLKNNFEYSLFSEALKMSGYMDTLDKMDRKFTVLAIKNSIWNEINIYTESDLKKMDRTILKNMIAYHIIPISLKSQDIPINQYNLHYPTLAGKDLYVHKTVLRRGKYLEGGSTMLSFSGSFVINRVTLNNSNASFNNEGDYEFLNGIIHNLTKLIRFYDENLQDYLERIPDYSIFTAALKHFGFWEKLSDSNSKTLFVPTNREFELLGITKEMILGLDVKRFNTNLLFGSYLMPSKRFFISDIAFYFNKEEQYWLSNNLSNNTDYQRVIYSNDFRDNGDLRSIEFSDYSNCKVGISKTPFPAGFQEIENFNCSRFLGGTILSLEDIWILPCVPNTTSKQTNDFVFNNGNIHQLTGLLVYFEQALLKSNPL